MKQRIQTIPDRGECIFRCTAEQRTQLDRMLYKRYPDAEWGTFFRFGYRVTPWGVLVTLVDMLPPKPGDFDEKSQVMEFTPGYIGRGLRSFDTSAFGLGSIHSHPEGCAPGPGRSDDGMDRYFAEEFEKFSGGRPYISLISSRDEEGRRRFSGRCFQGQWLPVTQWMTAGKDLLRREFDYRKPMPRIGGGSSTERASQLFGDDASVRLKSSSVAIIGCSGLVYARAALGDLSTHYLIPVIDMAVLMGSKAGRLTDQVGDIARYMPGLPCPWCRNRVSAAVIRAELATDEERAQANHAVAAARERGEDGAQYWIGERPLELTVGYMTTAVVAMGAGYAQGWLT